MRKYAMTRVGPGDYLLPDNDGTTLWRIRRYEEDGSLVPEGGKPIRGTFWSAQRCLRTIQFLQASPDPDEILSDWCEWDWVEGLLPTRAAAIASAEKDMVRA